jgi:hypothetical protein
MQAGNSEAKGETMNETMKWGYLVLADMMQIGQDRVCAINSMLARAEDSAVCAAKADRMIRETLTAHPAIAAAIETRRAQAVAAMADQPMSDGVARALRMED